MRIEEMEEFKEYKKAYAELLRSVLNMRFIWMTRPEDLLGVRMIAEQGNSTG